MDETEERWLPVPDYEGVYEVSDSYRVRRVSRITAHNRHGSGGTRSVAQKLLSVSRNNGYLVAYLGAGQRRRAKKLYIEALVETLFGLTPAILDEMSIPDEEWREIAGYEGLYQISNQGRVRAVGWFVNGGAKRRYARPKLLTIGIGSTGYPKVELAAKGRTKTLMVHRLVAHAFVPNPLGLECVHHKDENRSNPRAKNLEWTSRGANVRDWFDRRRVVVTAETIAAIGAALTSGKSPAEILADLPRQRKPRKG